jgi:Transposase DDE domain group 1
MRSSRSLDRVDVIFDDEHAVADAGLVLPATLAQHLELRELIDSTVDLGDAAGRANVGHKAMTLIHSALAGGDCIDDADALRAGDTASVLGHGVLAPSTLGTFLRSFTWGHARQLDGVSGQLLARAWRAGAGPGDAPVTLDVDATICETYGLAKQGGVFGHTRVRGYHPLVAVVAGSGDVVHCRWRGGNANSGRGAQSFLTETFNRLRAAGATGPLTLRADSGFYSRKVVDACRNADARFSITAKLSQAIHKAIAAIPDHGWVSIPYFLDGADVAETTYQPFGDQQPEVRLIVRRVRPTPGTQLALIVEFSYHAFITDRAGGTLELEADHRRHAEIENTIRDLKYGVGLNHLPSGRFGANAAWLALNAIAHNLSRWTGRIGLGEPLITHKTLRRRYLRLSGRLTRSARRATLHLPE